VVSIEGKKVVSTTAFAVVLAAIVAVAVLYLYNIIQYKNYPDFGFGFRTSTGIKVVGFVRESGVRAGMKMGDRILKVNGKPFATLQELRELMRRDIGEKNTYLLARNGREFEVTITTGVSGLRRSLGSSGLPFLLGLGYALIGTLVFLMKPHQRTSWIFFIFTATCGLFVTFFFSSGIMWPHWLEDLRTLTNTLIPAASIHLALCFPEERNLLKKHPYVQVAPYLLSALLFLHVNSLAPTIMDAPKAWLLFLSAYMTVGVLVFLGSSVHLRLTSVSQIIKLRSGMILLGFALAASAPLLGFIINIFFKVYIVPSPNYYLFFFILFPVFVGYSIVKHDLFDIDAIIKRTYGYVLTTGAIAGVYGLFVLLTNLAFGGLTVSESPAFPLIFILAVVFLFNPVRNRMQRFIDRVFYRLEYDYQETVQSISETMRSLLNLGQIGKAMMDTALGAMFIDSGSVMLLNPQQEAYECLIAAGEREKHGNRAGAEDALAADEIQGESETSEVEPRLTEKLELSLRDLVLPADEPLIRKIAEKKKEVTVYDIEEDPLFEVDRASCKKTFDQMEATLIVPLIYEDRLTGLISLGQKKSGKFYRREDINLLSILANQGAVAIENAMMVEDVIEKERMEEELTIARDLQTSMLPATCPEIEGFQIAATSIPAREVGGDFFDFIEMGKDRVGLVIADVTGKSVSGALVMSASRSVFRMLSEEKLTVGEIMVRANRRTKKDIKSGMFVALLYAVIDARDQILSLSSAGQTQPVHVSAKTGEARLVETVGDTFPLGILEDADYQETRLKLASGDKVVFYTDGIVEAMNEQEELFGFDRLLETVQMARSMSADSLLKEVLDKVNEFAGGAAQHDDLTVIVVSVA
jgi:serine phosphatase RsbU (regulator of sigma subunit)